MRERARKIRGQLTIRSQLDHGTEVALVVPTRQADARQRWRLFTPPRFELEG